MSRRGKQGEHEGEGNLVVPSIGSTISAVLPFTKGVRHVLGSSHALSWKQNEREWGGKGRGRRWKGEVKEWSGKKERGEEEMKQKEHKRQENKTEQKTSKQM